MLFSYNRKTTIISNKNFHFTNEFVTDILALVILDILRKETAITYWEYSYSGKAGLSHFLVQSKYLFN